MTKNDWHDVGLFGCTILGGTAGQFSTGEVVNVEFQHSLAVLARHDLGLQHVILYPEIVSIAVTGPGRVASGGGFIGGGFGVSGALEGMAIASILNTLTTRTEIHTIIELVTHTTELFLHFSGMEPGATRIALSPIFTRLRELDPAWIADRMARLSSLRERGILSTQQFERLAAQLTASAMPIIDTPVTTLSRAALEKLSRALCPGCDAYNAFRRDGPTIICEVCGKKYPAGALAGAVRSLP